VRRIYRKKEARVVVAVRLDLDTRGFTYRKWGDTQTCKRGDWLVDNDGDIYTVDAETFDRTYCRVAPGHYVKSAPVWAEIAESAGSIRTKEGTTHYGRGAYLVYNDADSKDGYAVEAEKFESMYEPV
jgi:hypothetical protein